MKVGVIGAGAISDIYISNMIHKFDNLEVVAVAAAHPERARMKAEKYGIRACSVEELLADPEIEMVVNLTPVGVHYELVKQALMAGKHVYTEKTMTDAPLTAKELLALAEEKHLYLGCAPDTFLGASLQTVRKALDDGLIGEVTSVTVSGNRDNNVLLSLFAFLSLPGAGVLYDYGVYYMTALVSLLGPVAETSAFVRAPYPQHKNINPASPKFGQIMDTPNESEVSAILRFESGITGTFHINSDSVAQDQAHMIIYGTDGMLYLSDPNQFGGEVYIMKNLPVLSDVPDLAFEKVELPPANDYGENERGIGPSEMAEAIAEGRPNRASKEMAYHVLEVLTAMLKSDGQLVKIESRCEKPCSFGWGEE